MNDGDNALLEHVRKRISYFEGEMLNALDENDSLKAFRARAVQCELQAIINIRMHYNSTAHSIELDGFLSSKEAARLLGVYPTTVTRDAVKLQGVRTKKGWRFPRNIVESQINFYRSKSKPGKRPNDTR